MKNFDYIRFGLILGIFATALMLVREYDSFQTSRQLEQTQDSGAEPWTASNDIAATEFTDIPPTATDTLTPALPPLPGTVSTTTSNNRVRIASDVLDLQIDLDGGDIVNGLLLQHHVDLQGSAPIQLLVDSSSRTYVAQSGFIGTNATDTASGRPRFQASTQNAQIQDDQDSVSIDLLYAQGEVLITKRFTLNRGDYLVQLEYLIDNRSTSPWSASLYSQFKRDSFEPVSNTGMGLKPFVGPAVTTPDQRYRKFSFNDIDNEAFQAGVDTGWVAMLQHYFMSAWIPAPDQRIEYTLRRSASAPLYYAGFTQSATRVAPGETGTVGASLYVGPKDQYRLKTIAENLDLTVDYGWVWWAAQPLYAILYFLNEGELHAFGWEGQIFSGVANWGISIILLTLIVKLAFFQLSATSYRSMAKMRKLAPKMAALKERYGDDKQAFSQEMMRLYQKEKVNPLGGCLPILVQMPVFIALYWVLMESVEIRHQPFFGWITDLSAKDPWFILPLIMGASMWFQMKLNPPPPDPMQAKMMQWMPVMFTFMFMWFPAGLVLYWCSNNILSIAQQWVITRQIDRADDTAEA